jgi:nitroreductase
VPLDLVRECFEIAIQAPSGSNARGWHFVVVTQPALKQRIGELYRQAFEQYRGMPISAHALAERTAGDEAAVMRGVVGSAEALARNLHSAPVLVIPCVTGRPPALAGAMGDLARASLYGSILPAFWSFMLAARARGLGTAWTTLHLLHEQQIAKLLGIPYEEVHQTALTPVAFTKGSDFRPARGRTLERALHVDGW